MVCKAPFHIRFAIHDNRSKVFVRVEDNVVRVIAKRGQKILLDSVEVRRSLVTSEKKVEVFTKSLSSDAALFLALEDARMSDSLLQGGGECEDVEEYRWLKRSLLGDLVDALGHH